AKRLLDRGDYAEAIEAIGPALGLEPTSTEPLLLRATARTLAGDEDGAREDLDRAVALAPADPGVRLHRGGYFYKTGRAPLALRELDRAVALGPEDPDTYSSRARVLIDLAQHDVRLLGKAIADLNQAIRRSPDSAELHTLRGVAFWMRGSEVAAAADFSRAIALAPEDGEAWFCRARSRSALRDAAGAEADLKRAAELGHAGAIATLQERPETRWK
ncbi:MAG: tetratricopeptide repeat protein, partial [Byssovorax sp.]